METVDLAKYLPDLPFKPFRLLYRDTTMDPEIGQVVLRYLRAAAKHLHDLGDQFRAERQLSDGNIPELVAAHTPYDGALFLLRSRWPVLVRWQVNRDHTSGWILSTLLVGPTGRQIVRDALSWHTLAPERAKFAIYQVDADKYGPPQSLKITRTVPPDRTSWYVVPEEVQEVRSTVRFWLSNQRWYQDRGMPWRIGVELEGPPGTGKSTLVKVLAQELDVPLMVISPEILEGMRDWSDLWSKIMVETRPPIFVLVEDFDLALRPHLLEGLEDLKSPSMGRKRNSRSTMSSMMNLLDGVSTPDGVCFFVTTNNPEDVEQAVIRPGRIDRVVHIGVASERLREAVARRVLLGFPPEEIDLTVGDGKGETIAAFRNRCQKMALKREIG